MTITNKISIDFIELRVLFVCDSLLRLAYVTDGLLHLSMVPFQ